MVMPRTGGMSVAPSWRELPYFIIPERLRDKAPKARGKKNEQRVWRYGNSDFLEDKVTAELNLWPDNEAHGVVEPSTPMMLAVFQSSLAATRNGWQIDED